MNRFMTCAAVAMVLALESHSQAARYAIQEIGDLSGGLFESTATALNNLGQVVGISESDKGTRGFLWDAGQLLDLGDLPGGGSKSIPNDINDVGQIVGYSESELGNRAFRWEAGHMTDLGALPGGGGYSYAHGINSQGQVVGTSFIPQSRGFMWDSQNGMINLGVPPGGDYSTANAVNDLGQVALWTGSTALWEGGTITKLGDFPGHSSSPESINNLGQVVGRSSNSSRYRATLWSDGQIIDLGDLPGGQDYSWAFGINDHGQIVGGSSDEELTSLGTKAVLWENGVMYDLNEHIDPSSGWQLERAIDVNNSGQIVGLGRSPRGFTESFLLTPVPEPSSLTLLALFAGGIALRLFCSRT